MKANTSNGLEDIIAQAVSEMKEEQGVNFSIESINITELSRRTGITRSKLRRYKQNGFKDSPNGNLGRKTRKTLLSGYTAVIDDYLKHGVTNSVVIYNRLQELGYRGKTTILKDYIREHKYLVPAKRRAVDPQGNRGRRYITGPGEAYQMDWGFVKVMDVNGSEFTAACFAMICHHCGERYIEFFPNAKQENLFIGIMHAFMYMGIPENILTDNMKSVVISRDFEGNPVWQKDYEAFMKALGFHTKLCKPRHPFTKGKVERLVRFVKENFLAFRAFYNISDLNSAALEWCNEQNNVYHRALNCIPSEKHLNDCAGTVKHLEMNTDLMAFLCPERRISFDGFVNYEGRRFGIPYSYTGSTVRVMRDADSLYIYTPDLKQLLVSHPVTWSRYDRYCEDQYLANQPEEQPTMPVHTTVQMLAEPDINFSFEKFNFDLED